MKLYTVKLGDVDQLCISHQLIHITNITIETGMRRLKGNANQQGPLFYCFTTKKAGQNKQDVRKNAKLFVKTRCGRDWRHILRCSLQSQDFV